MADAWKLKERDLVFKSGRNLSKYLGDIAQNETVLTSVDLANELTKIDDLIKNLEQYKSLIIKNAEPFK